VLFAIIELSAQERDDRRAAGIHTLGFGEYEKGS
jgi:hypothetical protein